MEYWFAESDAETNFLSENCVELFLAVGGSRKIVPCQSQRDIQRQIQSTPKEDTAATARGICAGEMLRTFTATVIY